MTPNLTSPDPACWLSADVSDPSQWLFELTDSHLAEIESAVRGSIASGEAIQDINRLSFPLPTLGPALEQLSRQVVEGIGFVMLRGLPAQRYNRDQTMRAYFGIGAYFGCARPQNSAGHLIGHVCDLGEDRANPATRVYRTNARQRFHVDSCDVVALLCLHPAKAGGRSHLCSSLAIVEDIRERRPELVDVLSQPFVYDRKGEIPPGKKPHYLMPVLTRRNGQESVYFARDFIESAQARFNDIPRLTPEQTAALDLIEELAESDRFHINLDFQPGDIQFVHNHVLLHSREAYEDFQQQERKRHLLRLWLSPYNPRALSPAFEERYGPIINGQPRGGIFVPGVKPRVAMSPE